MAHASVPRPKALERPIWNTLTSGWAEFAEGDGGARRLRRDLGMFGAAASDAPENLAALVALIPKGGELWTVEATPLTLPRARLLREARVVQMIADTIEALPATCDVVDLGEEDASAMFALATLTEPGPYVERTDRLGRFVGVRRDGALIAMAGERMRMPGLAEVSAVCTHPDWRGRGLASALMCTVAARMLARGERPFLHAYASNAGAIDLYESLGFRRCGEVHAQVWGSPAKGVAAAA